MNGCECGRALAADGLDVFLVHGNEKRGVAEVRAGERRRGKASGRRGGERRRGGGRRRLWSSGYRICLLRVVYFIGLRLFMLLLLCVRVCDVWIVFELICLEQIDGPRQLGLEFVVRLNNGNILFLIIFCYFILFLAVGPAAGQLQQQAADAHAIEFAQAQQTHRGRRRYRRGIRLNRGLQ